MNIRKLFNTVFEYAKLLLTCYIANLATVLIYAATSLLWSAAFFADYKLENMELHEGIDAVNRYMAACMLPVISIVLVAVIIVAMLITKKRKDYYLDVTDGIEWELYSDMLSHLKYGGGAKLLIVNALYGLLSLSVLGGMSRASIYILGYPALWYSYMQPASNSAVAIITGWLVYELLFAATYLITTAIQHERWSYNRPRKIHNQMF